MQTSTKQKCNHLRRPFRKFPSNNHLQIHMPIQKYMHRLIPLPIKLLISRRIPPILIKFPIVQFRNFSKNIRNIFESYVEEDDDQYCAW